MILDRRDVLGMAAGAAGGLALPGLARAAARWRAIARRTNIRSWCSPGRMFQEVSTKKQSIVRLSSQRTASSI
jgi:hypothetical protein